MTEPQSDMPNSERISFQRLLTSDIKLIHRWLHTPHVSRWWYADAGTYEEVFANYSAYIEGREPVEPYLILYEHRPIGCIQTYRISDDEEYESLVNIEDSAAMDLFIGEEDFLYKGFGPNVIRRFLEEVVFANKGIQVCVIDPEPENKAAIRAYERSGFRYFKSVDTSEGPAYLMKQDQPEFFRKLKTQTSSET